MTVFFQNGLAMVAGRIWVRPFRPALAVPLRGRSFLIGRFFDGRRMRWRLGWA
jgi:hypothetical protein